MPLDHTNPYVLKFLSENYEREKIQRMGWFLANKEQLVKQATLTEKHKGYRVDHILRAPVNISLPMLTRHHESSRVNRRKKVSLDGPILGLSWIKPDHDLPPRELMRPVEEVEKAILYEPLPLGGLRQYLNARKRKLPEEKYYFCETSSNVIGWQWKDSAFPIRLPQHGRRDAMRRETARSGPQPDPPHYAQPQAAAR